MPFTDELYDPLRIIIDRDDRQRTDLALDEGFLASVRDNGVIEPIVVHRETWRLVAGERRTRAAIAAGIRVPIRFFDTLDARELKKLELEENVKRADLPWRDSVRAYSDLHALYTQDAEARGETWSVAASAKEFAVSNVHMYDMLRICANLQHPAIASAATFQQARGVLQRFAERKAGAIVAEITARGSRLFSITPPQVISNEQSNEPITATLSSRGSDASSNLTSDSPPSTPNGGIEFADFNVSRLVGEPQPAQPQAPAASPVITFDPARPIAVGSFLDFAPTYSGPPFTFVHCDFPYGVNTADSLIESYDNDGKIYWTLLDALCAHTSRLFSYSSHLMFWLSMRDDYFQPTKQKLRSVGFHVIDRPLIWLKSDSRGAAPGVRGTQPRHIYEAALLCSRGQRPLVKQFGDGYSAPSVSSPIHPTQKPEAMLKHFFSGIVDGTTTFFDPTAGSGAALRVAEDLGARSAFGLELSAEYAAAANASTLRERAKRRAAKEVA